jgi:hypothetical protein
MRMAALLVIALWVNLPQWASAEEDKRLTLLVAVTGTSDPLDVYFRTDGDFIRQVAYGGQGVMGYMFSDAIRERRETEFESALAKSAGQFARKPILERSLQNVMAQRYPAFSLEFAAEPERFVTNFKPDYTALQASGHRFLLVLDDRFSGLSMLNAAMTKTDDVAPYLGVRMRLFDVKDQKAIAKGDFISNETNKMHVRDAVNRPEFLTGSYEKLATRAMITVVGELFRSDKLHFMAASAGAGAKVPAVSTLMSKYLKEFSFDPQVPKGWRVTKTTNKYGHIIEPKGEVRYSLGVRHDVDLLLPEFGQDVEELDGYLNIFWGRLRDAGYDTNTLQSFIDFSLAPEIQGFSIVRPDGLGKELIFFRKPRPPFVEIFSVVITKDFDALYAQHKDEFVGIISESVLKTK